MSKRNKRKFDRYEVLKQVFEADVEDYADSDREDYRSNDVPDNG